MAEYLPDGHSVHDAALGAPGVDEKRPAGHGSHDPDAVEENRPAAHSTQRRSGAEKAVPGLQLRVTSKEQLLASAAPSVNVVKPASHAMHADTLTPAGRGLNSPRGQAVQAATCESRNAPIASDAPYVPAGHGVHDD